MSVAEPLFLLPDGRGVWIYPLTFGRARIVVGKVGNLDGLEGLDDGW